MTYKDRPVTTGGRMSAVQIRRHGGPDVLEMITVPVPVPGPGEALIRNAWIGVNFVDLQHRAGSPYPVRLPLVPGTEAAGWVEAVGDGPDPGLLGRPVVHFGHLFGVYAECTVAPIDYLTTIPPAIALDDAAAVALAGTTAHVLVRRATSVSDKVIVVHAAAGSTGGAIVQLARAEGARIIAVVSTRAKAELAVALGAHAGVAAQEQPDLAARVRDLTGGRGADIVFDASGRSTFEASLRMLATRGTLVLYGASGGHPEPFDVGRLSGLSGSPDLHGSLSIKWVAASDFLAGSDRAAALRAVLDDVGAGRLTPRIVARLPLRDAAFAHARLEGRAVTGKLLLQP